MNLKVSFEEKDDARLLGARWDAARKTWFIKDAEDLTPFMRWITPTRLTLAHECKKTAPHKPRHGKVRIDSKPGVATKRTDFSLPDCGCTSMAPWEHCAHSTTNANQRGA